MRYDYDMLGTELEASMEAGERWMLNEAKGAVRSAPGTSGHAVRTEYDFFHRPLYFFVRGGDPYEPDDEHFFADTLFNRIIYGDSREIDVSDLQRKN